MFHLKRQNSGPSISRKVNNMIYAFREKMIYIDVGYKAVRAKPTNDEKILKIRRVL